LGRLKQALPVHLDGASVVVLAGNSSDLYTVPLNEFYECALVCDMYEIIASYFRKDIEPSGKPTRDSSVLVTVSRLGNHYKLVFFDQYWRDVNWTICEDDGEPTF
jgi:hypothetical protein